MRLGATDTATIEVTLPRFDDAYALGALGRWLPGLIQSADRGPDQVALTHLLENWTTMTQGTIASATFSH